MLLADKDKRDQILKFVCKAEDEISKLLGRRTIFRLFVPSGELEAQFELRAVEWLIGQPDVDVGESCLQEWMLDDAFTQLSAVKGSPEPVGNEKVSQKKKAARKSVDVDVACARARLKALGIPEDQALECLRKADADMSGALKRDEFAAAVGKDTLLQAMVRRCTFSGTISAGGGSSQLSLAGLERGGATQLYSLPVGNRFPIINRMFSKPVEIDERSLWVERIRDGLRSSSFPQGVTGLFVGISAMYYAAKAAGVANRIVAKQEVVLKLSDTLSKVDVNDHRTVANLTLVKEIISWTFDENKSCFLFKRNWRAGGTEHVAGWTLGWYVTQYEADAEVRNHCACEVQRQVRGKQVILKKDKTGQPVRRKK